MSQRAWGGPEAATLAQVVRFLVGGGCTALIYSACFLAFTRGGAAAGGRALFAVVPSFLIAATCGLFIHGRWTFPGERRSSSTMLSAKFFAVQGGGFLFTAACTWLITGPGGAPAWLSIAPSVVLTPVITFFLQRRWVFEAA